MISGQYYVFLEEGVKWTILVGMFAMKCMGQNPSGWVSERELIPVLVLVLVPVLVGVLIGRLVEGTCLLRMH
jgi:hypothetical protein